MTDLELLREAAEKMRERAGRAMASPWHTNGRDGLVWSAHTVGDPVSGSTETFDAEHIASWDPAVALAVADWLDSEASHHASLTKIEDEQSGAWEVRVSASTLPQAVALARIYLGES